MSRNKISIILMVSALLLFTYQVSAQSNHGRKPVKQETAKLTAKMQVDTLEGSVDLDQYPELMVQKAPQYPETARLAKVEGRVSLKLLVSKLGKVDSVVVKQANSAMAELEEAAITVAKEWQFKPAIKNGNPVPVWVAIAIQFKLKNERK